jgi:hypothetical protein
LINDQSLTHAPAPPSPTAWLWGPISTYFRTRRMRQFEREFALTQDTRVLDVGGTERNWHMIEGRPRVLLINIVAETYSRGQFTSQPGDGTALPFQDGAFDIAYSNSVVEHLGTFARQQAFAREIRRVAPRYYVQTPYRWFPAEPHLLCLFIHWLPKPVYRRLVRWLSVWGWITRPDQRAVDEQMDEIRLLTLPEMRALFPDAEIRRERVLGLTKSLIAVRR